MDKQSHACLIIVMHNMSKTVFALALFLLFQGYISSLDYFADDITLFVNDQYQTAAVACSTNYSQVIQSE